MVALAELLATNWWPDECDVLGAETSNEEQFHNRQEALAEKHFVVWDVEGQDEIWRMRRQDYWGIDGLVRVVDRNDRSRTRRTMRACWFPAVEQELFDAVAAAEITEKLGLHNSRHRQWFSRSACADADDGFLESPDFSHTFVVELK